MMAGAKERVQPLVPGLVLCMTVAMAASFLTAHYGAPVLLFALLLGMAFNFVDPDGKFQPGVAFASKTLLRLGVALLGARITFTSMAELGVIPAVLAVSGILLAVTLGVALARLFGQPPVFGILTGGAVGICGASAALALSAVLPRGPDGISERDTIFTVVSVTTLSTLAMVLYPILATLLGFDDVRSGIFIGATVHDVAQVVGAGFSISDTAGETSTVVKLMRVALLVPVIAFTALVWRHGGNGAEASTRFPAFLIGFVVLMAANSLGLIPSSVIALTAETSRWLLILAIAALGTRTSLGQLVEVGPRAAAIVVTQTVALAGLAAGVLLWWP
jgi:uncharacterized integral membrane protein (TIGR00698 family)